MRIRCINIGFVCVDYLIVYVMYVYVIVVNTASLAGQRHRLSVSRMAHS